MWLIAEYEPVTLFSLKTSSATASGGKTLLAPTPYAIKMAFLDAACRAFGVAAAEERWPGIRDLQIAISPPRRVVVTNLFQKVLRPRRNLIPMDQADAGYFQKTIGYREYVHMQGQLGIAMGWNNEDTETWLEELAYQITYLGKRGGFLQLTKPPHWDESLPANFVELTAEPVGFPIQGTLQIMDDCATSLSFEKVNVYSNKSVSLGKDRITRTIVLPYRPVKSSRSFTYYERSDL